MNKELIEYYWNEITQCGEFVYEDSEGNFTTETRSQPFTIEAPSTEDYWKELQWYLSTQGVAA